MIFHPFPATVTEAQAAQVAKEWQATRHKSPRVGDRESSPRRACYRLPNGQLRPVYDPYRPAYPEGATPGLGAVHRVFRWFPNDTGGYDYWVTDFEPLTEE